jgi:hypothetical protein
MVEDICILGVLIIVCSKRCTRRNTRMVKWYRSIFWKDPHREYMKKKGEPMTKNIYGSTDTKTHQRRFHFIHYVWKYKFFVPALLLAKKLLDKHLVKEIPEGNHNRNIKIFNDSYEEALKKWHLYYLRNSGDPAKRPLESEMMKRYKEEPYLRSLKEIANTMFVHDTAYREFLNILLHELARGMVDYYSKYPDNTTGHLFYTTDIYDVNYYVLEKMVEYTVRVGVADAEKLLRERERVAEEERNNRRNKEDGDKD